MKKMLMILALAFALLALVGFAYRLADDDCDDREEKGRGSGRPPAAASAAYAAACGSCHWAYAPQLLPQKSWEKMLASLGDHFGDKVTLSEQDKRAVANYLLANAADVSSSELGRKVMRSLGKAAPSRVVEVPYIQKKHREIAPAIFARKGVGGLANCIACHPGAASLDFEDDRVRIPAN